MQTLQNTNFINEKFTKIKQLNRELINSTLGKGKFSYSNCMSPISATIPTNSYSTIFLCDQGGFICALRAVQGIIATTVFVLFLLGYKKMSKQQNNPLTAEDKNIYMLAMWQTLFLALYYFLFEEFVILATIRNFLIWIGVNILHVMCKIYWIRDQVMLKKVKYVINGLKVLNIISWFVFSLGEGSAVLNTDFNLGYNCRLVGWTVMSGFLFCVVTLSGYIALNKYEQLLWERDHTDPQNRQHMQSIDSQVFFIKALISCNFVGALIMFFWDFYAHIFSSSDTDCANIFSGNNFFRELLCFLLKLISMQLTPSIIYYLIYYKRKDQFFQNFQQNHQQDINIDLLEDNASQFNRTITSRIQSRRSLFSDSNPHTGSQYL